jgi:hypothetical protein
MHPERERPLTERRTLPASSGCAPFFVMKSSAPTPTNQHLFVAIQSTAQGDFLVFLYDEVFFRCTMLKL